MANRNLLPIAEPDITSYAHFAFSLSVMHTEPNCHDWVYSNFVQLYLRDWGEGIMMDFCAPDAYNHPIPSLSGSTSMTRSMILRCYPRFVDFVRDSIDDECYLSTYADEYYIPGTVAYQNRSNPHGILIHGYDDDKRQYHVAGYLANQTFGQTVVGYDEMEIAFKDYEPPEKTHYTMYTHLFKLSHRLHYDFRVRWVMEQLEDYALAKNSHRHWDSFHYREPIPLVWGIDVYDRLILKIHDQMERKFILDHRPFHLLWEHKRMMVRRIAYMARHGYHVCSPEVTEGYAQSERSAAVIRQQILKFWVTKDNRHLEEMIRQLDRMKAEESRVIERMLQEYRRNEDS